MSHLARSTVTTVMTIISLLALTTLLHGSFRAGSAAAQETDAAPLLAEAAAVMGEVQSFHFELATPRGETRFADSFTMLSLRGDVQRPDRFRATAMVDATIAQLELTVIGIGSQLWITDPLAAEPAFIEIQLEAADVGSGPSPADLINPDRLLLTAVDAVENPTIAGQDEVDGVLTTRINGVATLDPLDEAGLSGTPIAGTTLLGQPVQVAIWIDESSLVRQLDVYGPLIDGEAPNTVRRLTLSAFDEPVDIQPPAVATPAAT